MLTPVSAGWVPTPLLAELVAPMLMTTAGVLTGDCVINEPVRGSLPDPSLISLSGLELVRAYMRGLVPATPLFRLLGPRPTQASSGTAVLHQVISPWFEVNEDFVDLTPIAEYAISVTALTGAPPRSFVRTVNMSLRYLRPCTIENEMIIVRGRILHAGSNVTTVDALFEDALGRAVAHATGSVLITLQDPPPPPLTRPLEPVAEPVYPTPDPMNRPLDRSGDQALPPFGRLIGAELVDIARERVRISLPTSDWFCFRHREVSPGIVGLLGNLAIRQATLEMIRDDQQFVILNAATTSMAPVIPDGRRLTAIGTVRHRRDDVFATEAEVVDEDGQIVATIQGPCLIRDRSPRAQQRPARRTLLTVLFTDLVGSTERAQQLGDARWSELLNQHNAAVRRHLANCNGREVKTMGDGVLATFDSPTSAVRCALGISNAVKGLGLQIRAGIHTGECEVVGNDVAGLAVHVASRVQAIAQPGEILVSSTVHDLVTVSDIRLADRGSHVLRGVERPWSLFAVES
jgi:class 3 adenylate cyclase